MNKAKLTSLCHKISTETGLTFNATMTYYFLEYILKILAKSSYSNNFIFKGGFILANVVGLNSRSTVDIDFLITELDFSKKEIENILNKVFLQNQLNEITCTLQSVNTIKEDNEYGGFRIKILCTLENIRQIVPLDIATGDVITPHSINYQFTSIFNNEKIPIKAYPIETMLAEKIQTIYSRGFLNSRSKDYYDLYVLYQFKKNEINTDTLKKACEATFQYRKTEFNINKIKTLLEKLKINNDFLLRWKSYEKKHYYVHRIKFADVIDTSLKLLNLIDI